jgi:N6-adenosine-specific RNA methylase IME4
MPQRRLYANKAVKQQAYRDRKANPTVRLVPVSTAPGRYVTSLADLLAEGQRFGCIMADPPWRYGNTATRGSVGPVFPTMPLDELMALPIAALAAPDAHLHLWVTEAFLLDVKPLIEAWGFHYSGASLVWIKTTMKGDAPRMGTGNYWRHAYEPCLLGVRGSLVAQQHDLPAWFTAPRPADPLCTKPERARDLIEQHSPGPYLELFGRAAVPGWTVWGNECLPAQGRFFKERVG